MYIFKDIHLYIYHIAEEVLSKHTTDEYDVEFLQKLSKYNWFIYSRVETISVMVIANKIKMVLLSLAHAGTTIVLQFSSEPL